MKLLEAARKHGIGRFVQISTDEVYGSLPEPLEATEEFPVRSSSPYSASKAASDALAMSYFTTYKIPVVITRAANNYGPYQFPEKLIPLMIANAIEDRPLPVYGDGMQVRDWLYVDDHCRGVMAALGKGREGEIYNIGGNRSLPNLEVVTKILTIMGKPLSLIQHVGDRPGHDRRYALSSAKLTHETGWRPKWNSRLVGADHRLVSFQSQMGFARAQRGVQDVLRTELWPPSHGRVKAVRRVVSGNQDTVQPRSQPPTAEG